MVRCQKCGEILYKHECGNIMIDGPDGFSHKECPEPREIIEEKPVVEEKPVMEETTNWETLGEEETNDSYESESDKEEEGYIYPGDG